VDILDILANADTLRLSISLDYTETHDTGTGTSTSSGSYQLGAQCIIKGNTLSFTVNTQVYGITPFDLHFNGQKSGIDASGNKLVAWSIHEKPDKDLGNPDIHIDSIDGEIIATVMANNPPNIGPNCDGLRRSFTTHFDGSGKQNSIVIKAHSTVAKKNYDSTIKLNNIHIKGDGAEKSSLDIVLQTQKDECGMFGMVGSEVSFNANVTGAPIGGALTYQWSVIGAKLLGSDDLPNCKILLPNIPVLVSVSVTVSDAVEQSIQNYNFYPLTQKEYSWLEKICSLKMKIHENFHVNPLWDPLRDLVAFPYSREELLTLRTHLENVKSHINKVLEFKSDNALKR
jgi:hypothetical protein